MRAHRVRVLCGAPDPVGVGAGVRARGPRARPVPNDRPYVPAGFNQELILPSAPGP